MSGNVRTLPRGAALQLVIFDCDGVLFDSHRANIAYYNAVLARVGARPLDAEGERLCHSMSAEQLFAHLFPKGSTGHESIKSAAASVDYAPFYELMEPARDMRSSLEVLAARCALALATNRGRTLPGLVTRFGLDAFFRVWVGVLDVARPKPAPDLLTTCLERCDVDAGSAVYVGDSLVDRDAAHGAGVAFVSVGAWTGARWHVSELADLPALLVDEDAADAI